MNTIINTKIPDFKVQAYHEGKFVTVTQENLKGKWGIFFFYPADFTFVCPTELGDMADKYETFKKMGVEVYSVSTDTHFVHKAWHDASETIKKINYPMLADPTGFLSRAFGVYIEEAGLAYRGTFVVDPEGKIRIAEIHDNGIGYNETQVKTRKTLGLLGMRERARLHGGDYLIRSIPGFGTQIEVSIPLGKSGAVVQSETT